MPRPLWLILWTTLTLGLLTSALAADSAWIGAVVQPLTTPFCRTYRCTLESLTPNTPQTMGWPDGTRQRYRLADGAVFEAEVRPQGWISSVRLGFPAKAAPNVNAILTPKDLTLEAAFLSAATGRRFTAAALAGCHAQAREANRRDPDANTALEPLSQWSTPAGRPYKARCGVSFLWTVWAGWRQQ